MAIHAQPTVIQVFDRQKIRQNRNRAADNFGDYDFLFDFSAGILADRLKDVKRDFPFALQIGSRGKKLLPNAETITLDIADSAHVSLQADEEFLPFAQNSFDLITSNLGLHTVNDLPGALIQINRSLKPDGLFLGAMIGGQSLYELRSSIMQAEMNLRGGAGPRIAPMADKQQMSSLMQRAGFALPVVDSETVTVTYSDLRRLLHDLRGMGEGNALKDRNQAPLTRSLLTETEKIYRDKFSDDEGRIPATFEIIFLIGWAPHESQQKPLRPGSAEHRLSEALGTKEIKTGIRTDE